MRRKEPYWEYLTRQSGFESLEANPDRLSTEDTVWNTQQEEDEKDKIESFQLAFKRLSKIEQKVIFLLAVQGRSVEYTARELCLTAQEIKHNLAEAKKFIKAFHSGRTGEDSR